LIPWFDGVICSQEWKDALWDKFVRRAPRPSSPSELQYNDHKLRVDARRVLSGIIFTNRNGVRDQKCAQGSASG
jgi:hypothetical protein